MPNGCGVPKKHHSLGFTTGNPFRRCWYWLVNSSHVIGMVIGISFLIPSWVIAARYSSLSSLKTPKDARAHASSGKFYAFSAHPQLGKRMTIWQSNPIPRPPDVSWKFGGHVNDPLLTWYDYTPKISPLAPGRALFKMIVSFVMQWDGNVSDLFAVTCRGFPPIYSGFGGNLPQFERPTFKLANNGNPPYLSN